MRSWACAALLFGAAWPAGALAQEAPAADVDVPAHGRVDGDAHDDEEVAGHVDAETRGDVDDAILGVTAEAPSLRAPSVLSVSALTGTQTFSAERLRVVPRADAEAYLTLSPGLVRANHGGRWHTSSLYLRGFDAGEGQAFAASVEGVPLNEPSNAHAHGYLDLGLVIPEAIARVRISQGVFRPEQTDFSVAGSADYVLGPERRGAFAAFGLGSFHTYRLLAGWAAPREGASDPGRASFFVVDAMQGDGFGPNRAHASVRGNARVVHALGGGRSLSVFGGMQLQRHDSAGVIRDDARVLGTLPCGPSARSQLDCVVDPRQGGSAQRALGALTYDGGALVATLHLGARTVRFRDDFTGAIVDPLGDGVDQRYGTFTVGSTGTYTHTLPITGLTARVGWDARYDRGSTRMARIRRADGVPYHVVFDSGLSLGRVGAFGAGAYHGVLRSGLTLDAELSLRVDGFAATIEHRDRPVVDRDGARLSYETRDAFGLAVQPRGAIALTTASGFSVRAAAGEGARSNDAQALSDGERAPFTRLVQSELGASYALSDADAREVFRADVAVFHTVVRDDLVFDTTAVRNVPVGKTRRYGATVSLTYDDAYGDARQHALLAHASLGLADARFVDDGRSAFATRPGAPIPFVPRATGRLDIAYGSVLAEGRVRVDAGLGASFVGREPLPLGMRGEGYVLVDAGVTVGFRYFDLVLAMENVAGARYKSMELFSPADFAGYDGLPAGNRLPTRLYAAGAPRTFMITFRVGAPP